MPAAVGLYDLDGLHPTQMSVGMIEVHEKLRHLRRIIAHPKKFREFQLAHVVPGVKGPAGMLYIVDHHHLARALYEAGLTGAYCRVLEDFSHLTPAEFWSRMRDRQWAFPYDQHGRGPHPCGDIPSHVRDLVDDPHRSLAWCLRRAGGYEKTSKPFAEFRWAGYLRPLVRTRLIKSGMRRAVRAALAVAHLPAASDLPGFYVSAPSPRRGVWELVHAWLQRSCRIFC